MRGRIRHLMALVLATIACVGLAACGQAGDGSSAGGSSPADSGSAAGGAAVSGARRHILYASEFKLHTILERLLPVGPGPLEKAEVYRQVPARETILPPAYRIARLDGRTVARLSPEEIARRIRTAVDGTCTRQMQCRSHLVSIDDIGTEFLGTGGSRLRTAMGLLQDDSPWGASYAQRVVMYVPVQMIRALMAGGKAAEPWEIGRAHV